MNKPSKLLSRIARNRQNELNSADSAVQTEQAKPTNDATPTTPTSTSDSIQTFDSVPSQYCTPRRVDVWLPPDYANTQIAYPVIYMHDGQNLFDPATATIGVDWGIKEAMHTLIDGGETKGAIIVGIWNTPQRVREYMPQSVFGQLATQQEFVETQGGEPLSDDYVHFIVEELKPMIDQTYRTLADPEHTFIMGSSMGGLVSLYALCQYPAVFGGAGCVSTHWTVGKNALVDAMAGLIPPVGTHHIYFDYGTATLDSDYEPYQQRMDRLIKEKEYVQGYDVVTRKFEGAEHSERAWRERVIIPLRWFLTKSLKKA